MTSRILTVTFRNSTGRAVFIPKTGLLRADRHSRRQARKSFWTCSEHTPNLIFLANLTAHDAHLELASRGLDREWSQ